MQTCFCRTARSRSTVKYSKHQAESESVALPNNNTVVVVARKCHIFRLSLVPLTSTVKKLLAALQKQGRTQT